MIRKKLAFSFEQIQHFYWALNDLLAHYKAEMISYKQLKVIKDFSIIIKYN